MENYYTRRKTLYTILFTVLAALTALAFAKSLFISTDIDEGYALAVPYRMAKGDLLLRDMWEPHQFGGLLLYPFVALYLAMTGGTEVIMVAMRMVGILFHTLVGAAFCHVIKNQISKENRILLFFLHILFLPKWVQLPEFELLEYWVILLTFVCLCKAAKSHGKTVGIFCFLGGVCTFAAVLSYPSLVLLYPIYVIGLLQVIRKKRGIVTSAFTLGMMIPGIILVGFLLTQMTVSEMLYSLHQTGSDSAHSVPLGERFGFYLHQLIVPVLISVLPVGVYLGLKYVGSRKNVNKITLMPPVILIVTLCAASTIGMTVLRENMFYMQWRYLPILVSVMIMAKIMRGERLVQNSVFQFLVLPSLVSVPCVLLLTNMNASVTCSKLFPAVLGALVLCAENINENQKAQTAYVVVALALSFPLLVCRLLLVRTTGCIHLTIAAPMERIQSGPEKGIWMLDTLADAHNANYSYLREQLTAEDGLLYVGNESIYYLFSDAKISAASTQGTSSFDELFLSYFDTHAGKYPTAIAVDKALLTYPYYFFSDETAEFIHWIEEKYPYTHIQESDYLILYTME